MIRTLILISAACVLGCWAEINVAVLNDACSSCQGICFPVAHPKRCDAYLHCVLQKYQNEFFCPSGLCYDEKTKNCEYCKGQCQKTCVDSEKIRDTESCGGYFPCKNGYFDEQIRYCPNEFRFDEKSSECVSDTGCKFCTNFRVSQVVGSYDEFLDGQWIPRQCPQGNTFNIMTCSCSNTIIECSSEFKLSETPGKYLQKTPSGWIQKECGSGLGFNMTLCTCSDAIGTDLDENFCLAIDLPLKTDAIDKNGTFVQNSGVSFEYDSAKFDGNSHLTLTATKGNDLRDQLEISVKVKVDQQKMQSFAILGNNDCKENQETFSIYVDTSNSNEMPNLIVYMLLGENKSSVTLNAPFLYGQWTKITVVKQVQKVILKLNDQERAVKDIQGNINVSHCPMVLGKMRGVSDFEGNMTEFVLKKCPKA